VKLTFDNEHTPVFVLENESVLKSSSGVICGSVASPSCLLLSKV